MSNAAVDEIASALRANLARASSLAQLCDSIKPALAWLELLDEPVTNSPFDELDAAQHGSRFLIRHMPHVQAVLLRQAASTWHKRTELEQRCIFAALCPPLESRNAYLVASTTRPTLLNAEMWERSKTEEVLFLLDVAIQLARHHLLLSAYSATVEGQDWKLASSSWSRTVGEVVGIADKISNLLGPRDMLPLLPPELERSRYMETVSADFERLFAHVSAKQSASIGDMLGTVLTKLARHGYFASQSDGSPFWRALLPAIRSSLGGAAKAKSLWPGALATLASFNLKAVASSLLATFEALKWLPPSQLHDAPPTLSRTKGLSELVAHVFGPVTVEDENGSWVAMKSVVLEARSGNLAWPSLLVCWACSSALTLAERPKVLLELLAETVAIWAAPELVSRGDEARHRYLSLLLALCLAQFSPADADALRPFAHSRAFLDAIQTHLNAQRPSIRLRGMLIAEVVSSITSTDSPLRFGDEIWEGDDAVKDELRRLRALASTKTDWAAIKPDLPLASSAPARPLSPVKKPATARKPSVAPEKPLVATPKLITVIGEDDDGLTPYAMPDEPAPLDEEDLTEVPMKKRPKPPVYIRQLTDGLRATEDADQMAVSLGAAAALIRRKAGTRELAENAADLAIILAGLSDNFDLPLFEEQRLHALTLLASACPSSVAPCLIEQLFGTQYSLQQRHAMLTAVGLAATSATNLEGAFSGMSLEVSNTLPARKALPARTRALIEPLDASVRAITSGTNGTSTAVVTFSPPAVVAEAAVIPLLNRFWVYLGDSASVPSAHSSVSPYLGGAGSAIMLEPLILGKFFSTLALLLDRAVHSPAFLETMAPEALELVLALRVAAEADNEVLTAAFEMVLVVMQALDKLNMLREFARTHIDTLEQLRVWAAQVYSGARLGESRLAKMVAGVAFTLEELLASESVGRWSKQTRL